MIDTNQLASGVVVGMVLIVLGLVPGLMQAFADGISGASGLLAVRLTRPSRSRDESGTEFREAYWFALAGVAIVALTFLAYLAG